MNSSLWVVLASTIALAAPLVLGAMGGYLSERSGVMNIALEGKMLSAACATAVVGNWTGNAWAGLVGGIAVATAISLILWTVTQVYRIDHVIGGMAINAAAYGATNFLIETSGSGNGVLSRQMPPLPLAHLWIAGADVPIGLPLAVAVISPFLIAFFAIRTKPGVWLRAVGSDPDKARLSGIRPETVRLFGLIGTGVFCGLGGALIVGSTGRFTDNMTAGSGFIALAALILGGWRPGRAAAAAVGFGFLKAVQIQLQGTHFFGSNVPSQVWQILPYAIAVVALAGLRGGTRAPAGMGRP